MIVEEKASIVDEPLRSSDVLADCGLYMLGGRGIDDSAGSVRQSGVRCGRPLAYPVPSEDLPPALRRRAEAVGRRYFGLLFAFDLEAPPNGGRFTAASFEVSLSDERAVAVRLDGDGGGLGVLYGTGAPLPASATAQWMVAAAPARPGWLRRLAPRSGRAQAWTYGTHSHQFGWNYADPHGDLLLPRSCGMHALIEVPAEVTLLSGALGVHVEIVGGRRDSAGHRLATLRDLVPFAEALPGRPARAGAAVRLCMAADVCGYSSRGNSGTERVQRTLVDVLARARRAAGIDDSAVAPQPQGDGQFVVLPIGIDESTVVPELVHGLAGALRAANAAVPAAERIRLRVALHRGLMKEGDNGWIGNAAIAVHRILDSPPLRAAVREHAAADFVLGVPDVLYQDVLAHSVRPPGPDDFRPITMELPEKGFVEHGWLYVPEVSAVAAGGPPTSAWTSERYCAQASGAGAVRGAAGSVGEASGADVVRGAAGSVGEASGADVVRDAVGSGVATEAVRR